jgi:hypothetical protein
MPPKMRLIDLPEVAITQKIPPQFVAGFFFYCPCNCISN